MNCWQPGVGEGLAFGKGNIEQPLFGTRMRPPEGLALAVVRDVRHFMHDVIRQGSFSAK
jgi:hypothetical protein